MKKQTLFLLVNALILVLISLIMNLVILPLVPQDPEDKLFGSVLILSDLEILEEIPSEGSFRIIHSKMIALDQNDNPIGTVYNAIARNGYTYDSADAYGIIDLLVGIKDDKVYVEINDLRQTATYVGGIQSYIYDVFNGIPWTEVESAEVRNVGDLEAGATASASTGTIKDLILQVVNLHYGIVDEADPYIEMFAEELGYAYRETDETFVSSSPFVIAKEIAYDEDGDIIGHIYKLVGSGAAENAPESIALYVALAEDGTILGFLLPPDEYNHSFISIANPGSYYLKNDRFMRESIGKALSEILLGDEPDFISGASNTYQLIITLLEALNQEVTS